PVITDLSNIDKVSLIGNLSLELQCKHKVPRIAVDKVISNFEHIMNEKLPEINSDFKRKSFLNKNSILLKPTLIMIEDTKCYVVSVIEIIKIFLQHPYLQQYLNSPVSSNYTNCVMKDIVDGSNFSVHPGSAQCRERNVGIFLYMDEIELCNPLGKNRGYNKLCLVYCNFINIPTELRSRISHTYFLG
ncbi:hypothetical protein DMUE_6393, partial [Dictyocoela muelleri]